MGAHKAMNADNHVRPARHRMEERCAVVMERMLCFRGAVVDEGTYAPIDGGFCAFV